MYKGKKPHKAQRKHTYIIGLPQLFLWPCLADLPSATLVTFPCPSYTFPPALSSSHRSTVIYPLHQKPALPLAFQWSISQRFVTQGNLGLRSSSSTAEAQNVMPLSTHGLKYLTGKCVHPSCRLVPQFLYPIIWPSIEKAHPLLEEAVMSLRNWVTTAGHFVFFNPVIKLGHSDTEQMSLSDKGTEQTLGSNRSIETTSDLEQIQSLALDMNLITSARVQR